MTRLIDVDTVREMLCCPSNERVYQITRQGIIPAVKIGRTLRWSEDALKEFIANGGKSWEGGWKKAQ